MPAARFSSSPSRIVRGTRSPAIASAQPMTVDEFRRELVGVPLCGTPELGQFAGKQLCTVHLPDGTAILAGAGLVVYGLWEASGGQICRRNAAGSGRQAALRDLRAGRPQPLPQQRRRRLLPRAVRGRQAIRAGIALRRFGPGPARKSPACAYYPVARESRWEDRHACSSCGAPLLL